MTVTGVVSHSRKGAVDGKVGGSCLESCLAQRAVKWEHAGVYQGKGWDLYPPNLFTQYRLHVLLITTVFSLYFCLPDTLNECKVTGSLFLSNNWWMFCNTYFILNISEKLGQNLEVIMLCEFMFNCLQFCRISNWSVLRNYKALNFPFGVLGAA